MKTSLLISNLPPNLCLQSLLSEFRVFGEVRCHEYKPEEKSLVVYFWEERSYEAAAILDGIIHQQVVLGVKVLRDEDSEYEILLTKKLESKQEEEQSSREEIFEFQNQNLVTSELIQLKKHNSHDSPAPSRLHH